MTADQVVALLANGLRRRADPDFDPAPVVRISDEARSWLLCAVYPADHDWAFGLCDLGQGFAEVGDVRLTEIEGLDEGDMVAEACVDDGRRLSDHAAVATTGPSA